MSSSKFVSNLDGMNEGENFNKDLLKVKAFLCEKLNHSEIHIGNF